MSRAAHSIVGEDAPVSELYKEASITFSYLNFKVLPMNHANLLATVAVSVQCLLGLRCYDTTTSRSFYYSTLNSGTSFITHLAWAVLFPICRTLHCSMLNFICQFSGQLVTLLRSHCCCDANITLLVISVSFAKVLIMQLIPSSALLM